MLVYYFVPFIVSNRYLLFWVSNGHDSVTVHNWTHIYMNFFDHKDLGNHLLQLCPKVVKHPVYNISGLRVKRIMLAYKTAMRSACVLYGPPFNFRASWQILINPGTNFLSFLQSVTTLEMQLTCEMRETPVP